MVDPSAVRKVSCLINPRSGNGAGLDLIKELGDVAGNYFESVEVLGIDLNNMDAQVKRAARSDLILIGGGDGTVSQIVNLLGPAKTTIGLLPLGTANDLARELGIVKMYKRAGLEGLLRYYQSATPRMMSIWQLQYGDDFSQRRVFCCYVSFGFDAEAVAGCQRWRRWFCSFPAVWQRSITRILYCVAALRQLFKSRYPIVQIRDLGDPGHEYSFSRWRSIFISNIQAVMGLGSINFRSSAFDQVNELQIINSVFNYLHMLIGGASLFPGPYLVGSSKTWEIIGLPEGLAVQVDGEYESGLKCSKCRIASAGELPVIVG